MQKTHNKNGFEYKCDRNYFAGHWSVTWYYKPVAERIFLIYTCFDKIKTVKEDIEKFLRNPDAAKQHYKEQLARATDIISLTKDLERAERQYEKVNSPDFDLRGNNPNKEDRARKNAEMSLYSARSRLEQAKRYIEILEQ